MPITFLRRHVSENWHTIRTQLEEGTYIPSPIRRIETPKPNGGVRLLDIPTVTDCFIQKAISQVLISMFNPIFSPHSYGF